MTETTIQDRFDKIIGNDVNINNWQKVIYPKFQDLSPNNISGIEGVECPECESTDTDYISNHFWLCSECGNGFDY